MPRVRDLLYRFRPAGAPGGASATGVPADRAATVAAELGPLFGQLAEVERQCDSIQDAARRDAAAINAAAAERARAIVAEATGRLGSERAAAGARIRDQAAADEAAELAAARVEATAIRDRAARRMAAYVDRVVTGVDELIGAGQPPGPP